MHILWLIWWLSLTQIKFVGWAIHTGNCGIGECGTTASGHQKPRLCFFNCWRKGREKKEAKTSLVISLMQQQKNGWANLIALNACLLLLDISPGFGRVLCRCHPVPVLSSLCPSPAAVQAGGTGKPAVPGRASSSQPAGTSQVSGLVTLFYVAQSIDLSMETWRFIKSQFYYWFSHAHTYL